MSTLDEEVLRATEAIPGIAVLVLFGSRARGDHRAYSDLDVAVLPDSQEPGTGWHLLADIAVALADLAPEGRVDVVPLDQANDVLRQRVMEHGRVLINRDPEAWKQLRVRTMREYGDREWARRLYEQAQYRRLQERRPSGRSPKALESLRRLGKLSR
jgi:predicted nucleotidyltransferase